MVGVLDNPLKTSKGEKTEKLKAERLKTDNFARKKDSSLLYLNFGQFWGAVDKISPDFSLSTR